MADTPALTKASSLQAHIERRHYVGNPVTVFLTNGIKLSGTIAAIDDVALILERAGSDQSVFYQAISTIMPS